MAALLRPWAVAVLLVVISLDAAEVKQGWALFTSGAHGESTRMARQAIEDYGPKEEWQLLLIKSLLAQGHYPEALREMTNALSSNSWSVRLRWAAREVFQANGQSRRAESMVDEIINTVSAQPRAYREAADLLTFGQAALIRGADPKRVMDTVLETAKRADPKLRELYLVAGELALDKHDFALAAKKFEEGLKVYPNDPDLHFGVARAYAPSDPTITKASIESSLEVNTNHVGSLLLLADRSIDAEEYTQAGKLLDQVLAANPWQADAWAYRAVLAHLRNQPEAEQEARQTALKFWPTNPRVDHLIGRKLSQNYRFAEGATHQRQALKFDPFYLPAKAQLAQDLLRLGQEEEGWRLAEEVHRVDGYDVEAFNLSTLHETLSGFATLTNGHFVVRMVSHEAELYGPRVLELLTRARETLVAKYGVQLDQPTLIEIFNEQKDFAVRTFGMPGNPGYLGVCFGNVITANSPASNQGHPVNWEAVLWHEFCHVVTLQMTRNKMPRWLSEGISVHEELQANSAWGQHMTPKYREMILEGELTPVSKLSSAFMTPETPLHLQFAYYQSALVVDYLVRKAGYPKLRAVLEDLATGTEINSALEKHIAPMRVIEPEFARFARERAQKLAPGLDWEKPAALLVGSRSAAGPISVVDAMRADHATEDYEEWARKRTNNFYVLTRQASELLEQRDFSAVVQVLNGLVALYPDYIGEDSPYRHLARAHQALGNTEDELQAWTTLARLDDEALDAYKRLMEIHAQRGNWSAVLANANRYLAVNPLVPEPYRRLALAAEATEDFRTAIAARRALLRLDPADPAEAHFKLAQLLYQTGNPECRRHVLQALEEAPRYRAALQLLRTIHQDALNGRMMEPES